MPVSAPGFIGRRAWLTGCLLVGASSLVQAQSRPTGLDVELVLPARMLVGLRQDPAYGQLQVSGDPGSVDPTRGLPLIYVAAGVLLLPDLARSLVSLYRDVRQGGTVVEVRGGKLVIRHDDALPGDTIVVKDAAGKVTVHQGRAAADTSKWAEVLAAVGKK